MLTRILGRGGNPKTPLEPVYFSDELTSSVARLLAGGDRTGAVRLVRERTGTDLAVAVRAVDAQAERMGGSR